ncbi:hypothetical protein B484DRAFT_408882, partial [Ochromonadaceae sp. CCMP2298]
MENPTEVDPVVMLRNYQNNRSDRLCVFLMLGLAFASILLLPVLFCVKAEGDIGAPWVAIWTPMWVLDVCLLATTGAIL